MRPGEGSRSVATRDPVAAVLRTGLAVALIVFAVQSAIGMALALGLNSYNSVFDLDRNNGIPDLLSTAAILAAALGAVELAVPPAGVRWQPTALALLLSVIALDDVMQEEAGNDVWGVSVVVTLVAFTLLLLAVAREAPRRARLMILIGVSLLAVAVKNAYEYDQFLNLLGRGDQLRGDFDYELGIVLKQGLELLGWSFVATGIWAAAVASRRSAGRITLELGRLWPRTNPR